MNERYVMDCLIKNIKRVYPKAWVYHPSDRFHSGIPDCLCCIDGKFIAIEVKKNNGNATRLQLHTLKKIKEAGGFSDIIYGKECIAKCTTKLYNFIYEKNK